MGGGLEVPDGTLDPEVPVQASSKRLQLGVEGLDVVVQELAVGGSMVSAVGQAAHLVLELEDL